MRFAIRDDGFALQSVMAEFWDDVIWLPAQAEARQDPQSSGDLQRSDFDAAASACGGFRPQWVIVDHYGLDAIWHDLARSAWGCAVVAIDDLGDRNLAADILVDHNWHCDHRAKYRTRVHPAAALLCGPRYALIDQKFAAEPVGAGAAQVRSIGIFMGGTDPGQASSPILTLLREAGFAGRVEIVSTSVNPDLDALRKAALRDGLCDLSHDLTDLFDFFRRHDLFVLAAGGVTWERMAAAVPAIAVVTADNQRAIAYELDAEGFQHSVALADRASLSRAISHMLSDTPARQVIAQRGRALVDGRGAARVAAAILMHHAAPVTVRPADQADADQIFEWRNDPAIRAVSRNSDVLDLDVHRRWFSNAIVSPDRLLLIAEKADVPVGMVRFDRLDSDEFEISILVSPLVSGLRLGDMVIAAAQAELVRRHDGIVEILAETLPTNRASQQLFLRAGYRRHGNQFRLLLSPEAGLLAGDDEAIGGTSK